MSEEVTLSIDHIRDIIVKEMSLADDRVNIYNSKFSIPTDKNIFVMIKLEASKVYSSRTATEEREGEGFVEVNDINVREMITISIFSRNLDALRRKEEVVFALNSIYSQQTQEKKAFKISNVTEIRDVSELEASALLYRFDIDVFVLAAYSRVKTADYFDTLNVAVRINDGRPDMEKEFVQPTESLT